VGGGAKKRGVGGGDGGRGGPWSAAEGGEPLGGLKGVGSNPGEGARETEDGKSVSGNKKVQRGRNRLLKGQEQKRSSGETLVVVGPKKRSVRGGIKTGNYRWIIVCSGSGYMCREIRTTKKEMGRATARRAGNSRKKCCQGGEGQ